MSTICGLWKRGESDARGLGLMRAALPGLPADTQGSWVAASVGLGWRGRAPTEPGVRSAVTERLPRLDAGSGLALTASVRLDGRQHLCEALGIRRSDSAGLPDSKLILLSYARWGRACPEHLLGDYAFALWDAKRRVLFCARDHIGARPFYYTFAEGRFVFASGIGAVLAAPGVSGDLDEAAVATWLTFGSRPLGDRTCYRAVRRLRPGHALSVERDAARVHRWWRPEEVPARPAASDDVIAEECRTIMTEAVRDRAREAGRIGVHLSGGLDSSGVAVLAARELQRQGRPPPLAFSRHPPPAPGRGGGASPSEYARIEAVGRQESLKIFYRPREARDLIAFLRRDGTRPADGGRVREEVVRCAPAGQGVEVLLSGWRATRGSPSTAAATTRNCCEAVGQESCGGSCSSGAGVP